MCTRGLYGGKRVVITMEDVDGWVESKLCVYNEDQEICARISVSDPILGNGRYLSKDIPISQMLTETFLRVTS